MPVDSLHAIDLGLLKYGVYDLFHNLPKHGRAVAVAIMHSLLVDGLGHPLQPDFWMQYHDGLNGKDYKRIGVILPILAAQLLSLNLISEATEERCGLLAKMVCLTRVDNIPDLDAYLASRVP